MFDRGFSQPGGGGHATWDTLLVGVAPGGHVVLWLSGGGMTVEVCHLLATGVVVDWQDLPESSTRSREDFVRSGLARGLSDDELDKLAAEGASGERWNGYRQRWPWRPVLSGLAKFVPKLDELSQPTLVICGVNGEKELINDLGLVADTPEALADAVMGRSLPRTMELRYPGADRVRRVAYVDFNQIETLALFSRHRERAERSGQFALHLDVADATAGLRLYLRDDVYSRQLVAAQVKIYRAS